MADKIYRNDPCPCGSGLKFKHCCGKKGGTKVQVKKRGGAFKWLVLLVLCAGAVYAVRRFDLFSSSPSAPAAPAVSPLALPDTEINRSITPGAKINSLTGLYDPPPGPVPAGKVWSPDHGHWHNAPQSAASEPANPAQPPEGAPYPQPPGPVPEGKVWSPEHGHWHNLPAARTKTITPAGDGPAESAGGAPYPQPPGPVPEGKVWSPEHGHWHNDLSARSIAQVSEADLVAEIKSPSEAGLTDDAEPVEEEPVSAPDGDGGAEGPSKD